MISLIFLSLMGLSAVVSASFTFECLKKIETLAHSDEKAAQKASKIQGDLQKILFLNQELFLLYGLCPKATATAAGLVALRAKGEYIRYSQSILQKKIEFENLKLKKERHITQLSEGKRMGQGPCQLPAPLLFKEKTFMKAWNKISGFEISIENFRRSRWDFYHPRVELL